MPHGVPRSDGIPCLRAYCSQKNQRYRYTAGEADLWYVISCTLQYIMRNAAAGSTDGSLSSLTYVDESASKRLHLLQGQLTRNVQHVAGLNPKAFR